MKSSIRVCSDDRAHDRPVYTLADACPECGAPAVNSAPAPFDPTDAYGEYRRRLRRRTGDLPGDETGDD
ncbi:H/ACA RNA-protein complex component Nop10p [Halobacteriales archaeon SW_7_68_16]|nr:MAG: H/ACA RNA-protein complex component Nop10p [Halobacteriales archaeon SW_7_68_16]